LPDNLKLDGRSLAPLVKQPDAAWPFPAINTHSPHWHGTNHAIRSERFHYIRYADGGEELYGMKDDPNQWHNLAKEKRYKTQNEIFKNGCRQKMPLTFAASKSDSNRR